MNKKRTALITGASRGIGRATALALASDREYDCLILLYRNSKEHMDSLLCELEKIAPETHAYAFSLDVSSNKEVSTLVNELRSSGIPSPDLIVNNAAISHVGLLMDMSFDEWQRSISVNLNSLYNICHAFLPDLVRKQSGRIINVSSVWGLVGASCEVAYSATKGAVNAFTKALAKELAPSGIACNAIAFGIVNTDMNRHLSEEELAAVVEEVPASRMLSPEEAAQTIVRLADMPSYVTGDILKCDGGWI